MTLTLTELHTLIEAWIATLTVGDVIFGIGIAGGALWLAYFAYCATATLKEIGEGLVLIWKAIWN